MQHFQSIDLHASQEHIPVFSFPCAFSLTQQFIEKCANQITDTEIFTFVLLTSNHNMEEWTRTLKYRYQVSTNNSKNLFSINPFLTSTALGTPELFTKSPHEILLLSTIHHINQSSSSFPLWQDWVIDIVMSNLFYENMFMFVMKKLGATFFWKTLGEIYCITAIGSQALVQIPTPSLIGLPKLLFPHR